MTSKTDTCDAPARTEETGKSLTVVRSTVPTGLPYPQYRHYLRRDFVYSCAYCTMTESEAQAIRFTIDHYEPREARADLVDDYANLMYACDECNSRKGDRCPPEEARKAGFRFFRPDHDQHITHFEISGIRLASKSNTGTYTIESLDLNRHSLRRLRELRKRLTNCEQFVAAGILALKSAPIDRLPQHVKAQAALAIRNAVKVADMLADEIDQLLSAYAKSNLIGDENEADDPAEIERQKARTASLARMEALHPGNWRAPRRHKPRKSDR